MVSSNVRVVVRIACGLGVNGDGVGGALNQAVDSINEAVLGDRIEETYKVIVCGMESDVRRDLGEIRVEALP